MLGLIPPTDLVCSSYVSSGVLYIWAVLSSTKVNTLCVFFRVAPVRTIVFLQRLLLLNVWPGTQYIHISNILVIVLPLGDVTFHTYHNTMNCQSVSGFFRNYKHSKMYLPQTRKFTISSKRYTHYFRIYIRLNINMLTTLAHHLQSGLARMQSLHRTCELHVCSTLWVTVCEAARWRESTYCRTYS